MLRRLQLGAAKAADQLVHRIALSRSAASRARSPAESLGPSERLTALAEIARFYDEAEARGPLFDAPMAAAVTRTRVRRTRSGAEITDLVWASEHVPLHPGVRDKYAADERNARVVTRTYTQGTSRPAIVLVHGYLGGNWLVEERAWPIELLLSRGLDVVLAVLPFHGLRGGGGRPRFPGSDPRVTIEGFRQSVIDLRRLVAQLRSDGASAVGAMGMSLGGYTTALLSTLEPNLAFAVPFVPLASIADFAAADGRYVGTEEERAAQHTAVERAHRVVSPLARPSVVQKDGRLVVAARADHITPLAHAEKLAAHHEAPLSIFDGGHLLQLGRKNGFRDVLRMLERLGLVHR